jgi:hypothetical protein
MATKKILVSDNSGSTQELSTAHIGYNDVTNAISASKITAHNLSSSLPSGILQANGNFISGSVITGSGGASGSLLQFSGSRYTFNLPTNIGGDLSGSTTALGNVKVISVANVNSGTLSFDYGGTGLSSALSGVLIKGAGDTLQVLATADTGSVIGLNADGWFVDNTDPTTNYVRRVDVFVSSGTWTKKGNPRFLKVTIVGGGGGGGSGRTVPAPANAPGAGGGGGGGVTEILLEAANVSGAALEIGAGGAGGPAPGVSPANGLNGNAGTQTTFSCSLGNFYSTGGGVGGGANNPATDGTGGSSGLGNLNSQTQSGSSGVLPTFPSSSPGGAGYYTSGGGAGGGSGGAPSVARPGSPSGVLLFVGSQTLSASGGSIGINGQEGKTYPNMFTTYYLNGTTLSSTQIFGTGGGGGGASITGTAGGRGGNAASGSGGGGGGTTGGAAAPIRGGIGGRGGDGFVIIESY